jgi:hypothetical protein
VEPPTALEPEPQLPIEPLVPPEPEPEAVMEAPTVPVPAWQAAAAAAGVTVVSAETATAALLPAPIPPSLQMVPAPPPAAATAQPMLVSDILDTGGASIIRRIFSFIGLVLMAILIGATLAGAVAGIGLLITLAAQHAIG